MSERPSRVVAYLAMAATTARSPPGPRCRAPAVRAGSVCPDSGRLPVRRVGSP